MESLAARTLWSEDLWSRLVRWISLLACAGLLVVSLLLLARRAVGAAGPLPAWGVFLAPLTIVAVVALVRRGIQSHPRPDVRLGIHAALAATAVAFATALSAPASHLLAIAWLWVVLVAGEVVAWSRLLYDSDRDPTVTVPRQPLGAAAEPGPDWPVESPGEPGDWEFDDSVTQHLVRSVVDGRETVVGHLRADLRPGERSVHAHIAFCPPLGAAPAIAVRQTAGPAASVKAAEIQPYGARFDIRLAAACRYASVVAIRFEAQA